MNSEQAPRSVAAAIQAIIRGETSDFSLEYPCHAPSERRWFFVNATRFEGNGPVRVVMSHENITAAKLAEEDRQKFVSLVENCIDFIGLATLSGDVIYINPAARALVGLEPDLLPKAIKIVDFCTEAGKLVLHNQALPIVKTTGRWEGRKFNSGISGRALPIETQSSVFHRSATDQ